MGNAVRQDNELPISVFPSTPPPDGSPLLQRQAVPARAGNICRLISFILYFNNISLPNFHICIALANNRRRRDEGAGTGKGRSKCVANKPVTFHTSVKSSGYGGQPDAWKFRGKFAKQAPPSGKSGRRAGSLFSFSHHI